MYRIITPLAAALLFALPVAATADTINFEEFPADNVNGPMPAARYSALGVTFFATDDGTTWGGMGAGDPGNWDLEGTNGSTFMGFNGSAYGLEMQFDTLVSNFSLDASRALGSGAGTSLTVAGYDGAALIDSVMLTFGAINDWSVFALSGNINRVVLAGSMTGFSPYGVDNINWDSGVVVPLPMSGLLLLGGLGTLALRRKRPF